MPKMTVTRDEAAGTVDLHFELRMGRSGNWNELQDVLSVIKLLPASDRSYDPATKIWTVLITAYPPIKTVASMRGFTEYIPPAPTKSSVQYEQEFFYNNAPATAEPIDIKKELASILGDDFLALTFEQQKKLYRRKALELHPDRNNGNGSRMSELNSLWSAYNAN